MASIELKGGESRLWYDSETGKVFVGPGTDSSEDPLNGQRVLSDTEKVYVATASQTGTAAPIATELKPLAGITMTWERSSEGIYTVTADSGTPFTSGKTFPRQCDVVALSGSSGSSMKADCVVTNTSVLTITVRDAGGTPVDVWGTLYLEVVIYPS